MKNFKDKFLVPLAAIFSVAVVVSIISAAFYVHWILGVAVLVIIWVLSFQKRS